jgi:hypothetical protein
MDPLTATELAIKAGAKGYQDWSWWQKFRYGSVQINHPQNNALVNSGPVEVEGLYKKAKGHFWLITFAKDQYWLQGEIDLRPDGNWRAKINTGTHPGPRTCNLLLVRVSDFTNVLLEEIQSRSNKAQYYGPIKISRPPKAQFKIVQAIVVNVP